VFRLDACAAVDSGFKPAFRRNTAARVYAVVAAHNPEVAGSNPPRYLEGPENGAFLVELFTGYCPMVSAR
jgi:hypothetical protein